MSGEAGPRGEKPGAGERRAAPGRAPRRRGCELGRPERSGRARRWRVYSARRWERSSGVPGPGSLLPAAVGSSEGAPAGAWEPKLDRVSVARGEEAAAKSSAGWSAGVNRDATKSSGLGFPTTQGSSKLSPGRREDQARKKRMHGFFEESTIFPG